MAIIQEGIRALENGLISFGNYEAVDKIKVDDFACAGDVYKLRTHHEVTRLERNGKLLLEAVPGAALFDFALSDKQISFSAAGRGATQLTMELEAEKAYTLTVGGETKGTMQTNRSGKVTFHLELADDGKAVQIDKLV